MEGARRSLQNILREWYCNCLTCKAKQKSGADGAASPERGIRWPAGESAYMPHLFHLVSRCVWSAVWKGLSRRLKSYIDDKKPSVQISAGQKKKQTQESFLKIHSSVCLHSASSELNLPLRVRQQLYPASCVPPTHASKLSSLCVALVRRQMASVNYLNTQCQ